MAVQLPQLTNDQKALSRGVLQERAIYPVTFRVNADMSEFTGTDIYSNPTGNLFVQEAKTLGMVWTPSYGYALLAVEFSGTHTYFVASPPAHDRPGGETIIGAFLQATSTPPAPFDTTAQTGIEVDGTLIYNYSGVIQRVLSNPPLVNSRPTATNDYKSYAPYCYFFAPNTPLNIYFRYMGDAPNTIFKVIAALTLHIIVIDQGT